MIYLIQQAFFVLRFRYLRKLICNCRAYYYTILGMKIGQKSQLPKIHVTWPHQVSIGQHCTLEPDIYFKYDGIWNNRRSIIIDDYVFIGLGCEFNIRARIEIGKHSLIASGCKFIDHDHGTVLGYLMREQVGPEMSITIGEDVWLGCNSIILKGVQIGNGAIVGAGAIVTKSIQSNEIWAGIPARKIGDRKQK